MVAALPDIAVILVGLTVFAALAVFVIDTGRQIAIKEGAEAFAGLRNKLRNIPWVRSLKDIANFEQSNPLGSAIPCPRKPA